MKYLNNYKLYSKINLTFHMHQLHSPPMPSASAVPAWPARGAYLVCARYLPGARAVLVRCACDACLAHPWCARIACLVRTWPPHFNSQSLNPQISRPSLLFV